MSEAMQIDEPVLRKGRGFDSGSGANIDSGGLVEDEDVVQGEYLAKDGASAVRSVEGWIVAVTNVHEEASEEDIVEAFSEYGEVLGCHLNLDRRTGYVKGYALVEYGAAEEAARAIAGMDGKRMLEQVVVCDYAFVSPRGGERGRRRSGSR